MNVIRIETDGRQASRSSAEIAGFEALRAYAALAVVALHAAVPYARHPMPGLVWPIWDSTSRLVDAMFWSIEVVVMPLFLTMAGFLMWRSSQRLSPGRLVRSRARRLLIPLAFGVVFILPIDLYIWTMGLVGEGIVPAIKLKSFKFQPPISDQIWGLGHLWFLLYVFLYVVVAACSIRLASRWQNPRFLEWITRPAALLSVLSCIAGVILIIAPQVVWGFQHAFLPVPSKWVYSGVFFAAGCALARHDHELKWVASAATRLLAIGFVLLASSVLMGIWWLEYGFTATAPNHSAMLTLALLTVAAAGTTTFGIVGAVVRFQITVSRTTRYLASASFWIYLIHHPLLGLVHCDIKWLWPQGSPLVKLCVSFVAATGLSLLMYEAFVRRTAFGSLLGMNGPAPTADPAERHSAGEIRQFPSSDTGNRRAA